MNVLVVLTGGPGRPSTPGNAASPFLPWRNKDDVSLGKSEFKQIRNEEIFYTKNMNK